jgi:hypothetical protein
MIDKEFRRNARTSSRQDADQDKGDLTGVLITEMDRNTIFLSSHESDTHNFRGSFPHDQRGPSAPIPAFLHYFITLQHGMSH